MEFKKIGLILGLITGIATVSGLIYTGITKVNTKVIQIDNNTVNIDTLKASVEFDKLCKLYKKALSDYYYWEEECNKTKTRKACKQSDETKRRLERLEKQIEKAEKETGEICG